MKHIGYLFLMSMQSAVLVGGDKLEFFHRSLQHEDESMALHLLYDGLCVHTCTAYGETLLMSAAWLNRKAVVRTLMQAGVDVNIRSNYGATALMGAAKNGHTDMVRILITAGADLNTQDRTGNNALTWAVRKDHPEIVTLLVEAGAHVNVLLAKTNSPAVHALLAGNREVLVYLLEHGADLIFPEQFSGDGSAEYMQYFIERAACIMHLLERVYDVPRDLTRLIWCLADCPASATPPPSYERS